MPVEDKEVSNSNSVIKSEKKNVKDLFQNLEGKPNIFSSANKSSMFQNSSSEKGSFLSQPFGASISKEGDKKKSIFGGSTDGNIFKKTEKNEPQKNIKGD